MFCVVRRSFFAYSKEDPHTRKAATEQEEDRRLHSFAAGGFYQVRATAQSTSCITRLQKER